MSQDEARQLFSQAKKLYQDEKLDEAIDIFQSIKREDSPETFARAQLNLALIWRKKGEQEKAIAIYETIQREDNPKAFAKAQYNLALIWAEKDDFGL